MCINVIYCYITLNHMNVDGDNTGVGTHLVHEFQLVSCTGEPVGVDEASGHRPGVEDHVSSHAHKNKPIISGAGETTHCHTGRERERGSARESEGERAREKSKESISVRQGFPEAEHMQGMSSTSKDIETCPPWELTVGCCTSASKISKYCAFCSTASGKFLTSFRIWK